jgi:hypothetical protein
MPLEAGAVRICLGSIIARQSVGLKVVFLAWRVSLLLARSHRKVFNSIDGTGGVSRA